MSSPVFKKNWEKKKKKIPHMSSVVIFSQHAKSLNIPYSALTLFPFSNYVNNSVACCVIKFLLKELLKDKHFKHIK